MQNENGSYILIGHPDFRTGKCDFATTEFAETLEKYQVQETSEKQKICEEADANVSESIVSHEVVAEKLDELMRKLSYT